MKGMIGIEGEGQISTVPKEGLVSTGGIGAWQIYKSQQQPTFEPI